MDILNDLIDLDKLRQKLKAKPDILLRKFKNLEKQRIKQLEKERREHQKELDQQRKWQEKERRKLERLTKISEKERKKLAEKFQKEQDWQRNYKLQLLKDTKRRKLEKEEQEIIPWLVRSAHKGRTEQWRVPGREFKDPDVFLELTTPKVIDLIRHFNGKKVKKVNTTLVCVMVRQNPSTGEKGIYSCTF